MLTSFIDGRLRLRHKALKNPDTLALLERTAIGLEGVHRAVGNPLTGSLLLTYDPKVLSRETLLETADALQKPLPPNTIRCHSGGIASQQGSQIHARHRAS